MDKRIKVTEPQNLDADCSQQTRASPVGLPSSVSTNSPGENLAPRRDDSDQNQTFDLEVLV